MTAHRIPAMRDQTLWLVQITSNHCAFAAFFDVMIVLFCVFLGLACGCSKNASYDRDTTP